MTDYVKSTNFASKDSLATGNPLKIVKGTEIDTEFNNIATAVATKANSSDVTTAISAALVSPAFTGTPTAPTAAVNTNNTQLATTAFVVAQIADDAPTKTGTGASGTWGISITGNAATATSATTATTATTATSAATASTVTTVTTSQVNGAISSTAAGAVGSYATGFYGAAIVAGTNYAGSSIGLGSGTWKAMNSCSMFAVFQDSGGNLVGFFAVATFVRVS